jgi:hypothetical protein
MAGVWKIGIHVFLAPLARPRGKVVAGAMEREEGLNAFRREVRSPRDRAVNMLRGSAVLLQWGELTAAVLGDVSIRVRRRQPICLDW